MNYKDAYSHMLFQIVSVIDSLEQSHGVYNGAELSARLCRIQVECEEIRLGQNPYPIRHAPRSGSSLPK